MYNRMIYSASAPRNSSIAQAARLEHTLELEASVAALCQYGIVKRGLQSLFAPLGLMSRWYRSGKVRGAIASDKVMEESMYKPLFTDEARCSVYRSTLSDVQSGYIASPGYDFARVFLYHHDQSCQAGTW